MQPIEMYFFILQYMCYHTFISITLLILCYCVVSVEQSLSSSAPSCVTPGSAPGWTWTAGSLPPLPGRHGVARSGHACCDRRLGFCMLRRSTSIAPTWLPTSLDNGRSPTRYCRSASASPCQFFIPNSETSCTLLLSMRLLRML